MFSVDSPEELLPIIAQDLRARARLYDLVFVEPDPEKVMFSQLSALSTWIHDQVAQRNRG